MKLSRQTIDVFRWCRLLQPGLVVYPGSRISSISVSKGVILEATVLEEFPCEWAIADLNDVLPYLSESTEITFGPDGFLELGNGMTSLRLQNHDKDLILHRNPTKRVTSVHFEESYFLHADDAYELRRLVKFRPGRGLAQKGRTAQQPVAVFDSSGADRSVSLHYYPGGRDDVARTDTVQRHTITPKEAVTLQSRWRVAITTANLPLWEGSYEVGLARTHAVARFRWLSADVTLYCAGDGSVSTVDGKPLITPVRQANSG